MDGLNAHQQRQLRMVLALLESDEHAPTTVRDQERAMQTHVADSLAALELELAVALPLAQVSLVESQSRRCDFLRRLSAGAEIENVSVICARAEEWGDGLGRQDLVVARALAPQAVVLEYAAPLLREGGALVDWRGKRDRLADVAADRAAVVLGLSRAEVRRVIPFEGATDHHLHVFVKTAPTPPRFPRRVGVARKRPLGA
jgi:16S rRNA (guanine527-N7)-methyltransferase